MLNISRQIHTGWNQSATYKNNLPEASIVPFGEAANERKKLEKLTISYNVITEHDNVPLPGFTLYQSNRAHYGSSDPTWIIIDPRGFLARITQDNLTDILRVTGITEGLIQQRCVWAREDSCTTMSLIPISSPLYTEAVSNTDLLECKVSMSDVSIGDTVLLQNKLTGTYMGNLSLYAPMANAGRSHSDLSPQTFCRRQVVEIQPGKYHYQTNVKILKILKKSTATITRDESAELLNNVIATGTTYFSPGMQFTNNRYHGVHGRIQHASTTADTTPSITLKEIDLAEATNLFEEARVISNNGCLVLEDDNQRKFLIEYPWYASLNHIASIHSFDVREISTITENTVTTKVINKRPAPTQRVSIDNFTKFYKIVKHVKNNTYI